MALASEQKFSFGEHLQSCRLAQNTSLQVLSIHLRISVDMLTAIENEDYSKIPEPVFAKGFLRSFAKAVGADEDFVVQNYVAGLEVFQRSAQVESRIEEDNQRFGQRAGLSLGVLLVVMVLTVLLARNGQAPVIGEGTADQTPTIATDTSVEITPQASAYTPDQLLEFQPEHQPNLRPGHQTDHPPEQGIDDVGAHIADRSSVTGPTCSAAPASANTAASSRDMATLRLKVDALEETWLKIIIDNQKPNEYTLQPGDHLALGATSRFNVLIGNAAGVKLSLNEKVVSVPGDRGQVVTIDIP